MRDDQIDALLESLDDIAMRFDPYKSSQALDSQLRAAVRSAIVRAQLAAAPVAAQQDADPNAPWLSLAHMICADAGIPPGHITARLEVLRGKLAAAPVPAQEPASVVTDRDISELIGIAQFLQGAKHWEAQASSKLLAEFIKKLLDAQKAQPAPAQGVTPMYDALQAQYVRGIATYLERDGMPHEAKFLQDLAFQLDAAAVTMLNGK